MDESLEVVCQCGGRFSCSGENAGQAVTCPHCGQALDLPDADAIRPAVEGPATLDGVLPVESPRPDELPFMQSPTLRQPSSDTRQPTLHPSPLHQIGGAGSARETFEADTTDESSAAARASNPAEIDVEYARWFLHFPTWPLIWLSLMLIATALTVWSVWFAPLLLAAAAMNVWYWQRVRIHFQEGCVLPGVVASLEPPLFAYATDMGLGADEYPAVKIVRGSPAIVRAGAEIGTRLVGVAWYGTSDRKLPHWEDVDPRPVETASGDVTVLDRVRETVTEEEYAQLEQWRRNCPLQPGLFFVQADGTVKRYDIYRKHRS